MHNVNFHLIEFLYVIHYLLIEYHEKIDEKNTT